MIILFLTFTYIKIFVLLKLDYQDNYQLLSHTAFLNFIKSQVKLS